MPISTRSRKTSFGTNEEKILNITPPKPHVILESSNSATSNEQPLPDAEGLNEKKIDFSPYHFDHGTKPTLISLSSNVTASSTSNLPLNISTPLAQKRQAFLEEIEENETNKKAKRITKRRSPKKKEDLPRTEPDDWKSIYDLVQELRKDKTAPVDSVGAEVLPQKDRGEEIYRYQVLISLMLSSQTKDAVVGEAMKALQEYGLDVNTIQQTSPEKLNSLIKKVGFHNNKTKYIKETTEILIREYNGDIPQTVQEMMKLPGVGPKMAYIIESIAFKRNTGIGVDTHMHRVFNQLKWVDSKNPEQTRIQLQSWLPKEKWRSVNVLFVGFGQEVQQQKEKILKKALTCSRPKEALKLLKRLDFDYRAECKKFELVEELKVIEDNS